MNNNLTDSTSTSFLQSKWDTLLDIIGDDHYTLWVSGSIIYTFTLYWFIGTLFAIMDLTNKPAFMRKYKIQDGTHELLDKMLFLKVVKRVIFNQTIVLGIYSHYGYKWRGHLLDPDVRTIPSFQRVFSDIIAFIILEEIVFYYSHCLLHSKYLYKWIHKIHHEVTAPFAVTSSYCHPIEHILSNALPVSIGFGIFRTHIYTAWVWQTIVIFNTLFYHSGYHIPFLTSPERHDYHHLHFNTTFSIFGIMDMVHGTDGKFRNSKVFPHHILLWSLRSVKEKVRDEILNEKVE